MDQSSTTYQSSKYPKKSILFAGLFFIVVALIGIAATVYLSSRGRTTDSRSQASINNAASFEIVQRETAEETVIDVYADTSSLQGAQVRSFDVSVAITSTTSAVQGITTDRDHMNVRSIQRQREILRRSPSPSAKAEAGTKVCFDEVVQNGIQLNWKTTCKGDSARGNCVSSSAALTSEEKTMYDAWSDLGKADSIKCVFVKGIEVSQVPSTRSVESPVRSPIVVQTATSPVPTAQPSTQPSIAPTSTPTPVLLTQSGNVGVYKSSDEPFTYQAPVVTESNGAYTVVLTGKVENGAQQAKINGRVFITQIRIKKQNPSQRFTVKVTNESIKGSRAIAPGVEVELIEKSPSASPASQ